MRDSTIYNLIYRTINGLPYEIRVEEIEEEIEHLKCRKRSWEHYLETKERYPVLTVEKEKELKEEIKELRKKIREKREEIKKLKEKIKEIFNTDYLEILKRKGV